MSGHDDNRDFYMSNMKETTNMNRQLFLEWFPQIMYNHHQTGPAGAVIFMPPFRDPFNYNFDPLVPLGIEMVGTAMHSRLVAEGKGGSAMRSGANYSTWWNGGLRTVTYFHNMIGILTEIIGSPTPMKIPLVAGQAVAAGRLADADRAAGVALPPVDRIRNDQQPRHSGPGLALSRDVPLQHLAHGHELDREGQPRQLDRHAEAHRGARSGGGSRSASRRRGGGRGGRGGRGGGGSSAAAAAGGDVPGGGGDVRRLRAIASRRTLYNTVLHDPKLRDPRGYIIPSDQPDFANATEFVNALLKNGITVHEGDRRISRSPARAIRRDRTW